MVVFLPLRLLPLHVPEDVPLLQDRSSGDHLTWLLPPGSGSQWRWTRRSRCRSGRGSTSPPGPRAACWAAGQHWGPGLLRAGIKTRPPQWWCHVMSEMKTPRPPWWCLPGGLPGKYWVWVGWAWVGPLYCSWGREGSAGNNSMKPRLFK